MSSFTSNLGLIIMTPGDPSVANIWGANLNNSVFTLVDSAVAGLLSLSVAGSSNVVLTNTNGAADQERNAIFVFTGALTGNIDVLYPSGKSKVFLVSNNTTGSFALSVGCNNGSGSPAGAVATIPQGSIVPCYSDGTNVYAVETTTYSALTVTNILTGPDSGTWTTSGIGGLAAIGIGTAANSTYVIDTSTSSGQHRFAGTGSDINHRFKNSTGEIGYVGDAFDTISSGLPNTSLCFRSTQHVYVAADSGFIIFGSRSSGWSEKMRLASDGSFLVGATTAAGAGVIAASGNVIAFYSDDRLKTRLGKIESALDKVRNLTGFYYEPNQAAVDLYKSHGQDLKQDRNVGLSAQDVMKVFPEAVKPAPIDHTYMTIQYEKMVPLLVEAVNELANDIADIKAQLK